MDSKEAAAIERQLVDIAWDSGRILLDRFQHPLQVEWKGKYEGDDPVTEADRHAETFVKEELARRFPSHGIVGEEGAGTGTQAAVYTWVVDPLDGTTNFLNGLPAFACSIGLLERGVPVVAAIFIPWPNREGGRVLHARAGGGTWDGDRRIQLKAQPPESGRLMVLPRGPFRIGPPLSRATGERRSVGSVAYEMAMTTEGVYRYVLFTSPRAWDVAAGVLLVQEAGGAVYTRAPKAKAWSSFTSFSTKEGDSGAKTPGQDDLRKWGRPILAGNADAARIAAESLRPHHPMLPWLLQRARQLLALKQRRRRTTPARRDLSSSVR
ncbi:MAG: inositol monophosphatase [Dehalococcoidia bacterium]|nr:inositol monophosphatase [Dehalococcoidia bacterium]